MFVMSAIGAVFTTTKYVFGFLGNVGSSQKRIAVPFSRLSIATFLGVSVSEKRCI